MKIMLQQFSIKKAKKNPKRKKGVPQKKMKKNSTKFISQKFQITQKKAKKILGKL